MDHTQLAQILTDAFQKAILPPAAVPAQSIMDTYNISVYDGTHDSVRPKRG